MNILQDIDQYISEHINMSMPEFKAMFDHSNMDNISGPADIKVAISNAIKANRVLSKMRAKIKAMQQDKDELVSSRSAMIREDLYKYKKELKAGAFPLCDRDLVLGEYEKEHAKYEEDIKDEKKKAKAVAPVVPRFTTIDATKYTEADIVKASETSLKDIAKTAATIEIREELKSIMVTKQAVDELLEAVRKEMSALGSMAGVISSEQYGLNRQGSLEKKTDFRKPAPQPEIPQPVSTHTADW